MKWMGWNYEDYCNAPQELVSEIITMINQEAEAGQ